MSELAAAAIDPVLGTVRGNAATDVERLFDGFFFYLR